jgi:hypothetical protein
VGFCGRVFIPCKPVFLESICTNCSSISCALLVKHVGYTVVLLLLSHISQGDESYKLCLKIDWISLGLVEFDVDCVDYSMRGTKKVFSGRLRCEINWSMLDGLPSS